MIRLPPRSTRTYTLLPYTTLFRSEVCAALVRLRQGDLHDLFGDTGDLDVHLERGDAHLGACNLEVHVAEVILVAKDVGDDGIVLALKDKAHGDARHRTLLRNARVHHRQRAPAHRRHGRGTVGLGDVLQHADRLGEIIRPELRDVGK